MNARCLYEHFAVGTALTILVVGLAAVSCTSSPVLNVSASVGVTCERFGAYVVVLGASDAETSANYTHSKFARRGVVGQDGACAIGEFGIERGANDRAVLLVVGALDPVGNATDPAACGADGFRNCLVMRSVFSSTTKGTEVLLNSDLRCLGMDCGEGSTCTRGVCVTDVSACDNGGPDGTPPDCCPPSSILIPPQPYADDPCPDASADASSDAACGVGFCTAPADSNAGLGSCLCGGGAMHVGVACLPGGGEPANIGGVFGRRCICDLDATPVHPIANCSPW